MKNKLTLIVAATTICSSAYSQKEVSTTAPYTSNFMCINGSGLIWSFGDGPNGKGLYNSFNGWNYIKYDTPEDVISAYSSYGNILIATSKGEVKSWNSNNATWFTWYGMTNAKAVTVGEKDRNMKYAVGSVKQADGTTKKGIFKVKTIATKNNVWQPFMTDVQAQTAVSLAFDRSDNLYFVTSSGRVFVKYSGNGEYKTIDTKGAFAQQILLGSDGNIYMKVRGGTIYKLDASNNTWTNAQFSANSFGVDDKGNVYGELNGEIKALINGSIVTKTVPNPNKLDQTGNTLLTTACLINNSTSVSAAIAKGCSPNVANKNGDYPIIIAAKNTNDDILRQLIQKQADVNVTDKSGKTALHYLINTGDDGRALTILRAPGFDPAKADYATYAANLSNNTQRFDMLIALSKYKVNMEPAMMILADKSDVSTFRTLTDRGVKVTNAVYEKAATRNDKEIAGVCLDKGINKTEALKYSVKYNQNEMIGLCLQKGAEPTPAIEHAVARDLNLVRDLIDKYNVSPERIISAAIPTSTESKDGRQMKMPNYKIEPARVALQKGAKPDPHINGVVKHNSVPMLNLLLEHGADPNKVLKAAVVNSNKDMVNTALGKGAQPILDASILPMAIDNDQTEIALILINGGAAVTSPTVISKAVAKKNEKVVMALLEKGAPTSDKNLIKTSVTNKTENISLALLRNGADPNYALADAISSNQTSTALLMLDKGADASKAGLIQSAARTGNTHVVNALIDKGASPDNGMMSAISSGKTAVFNILIDRGADATKNDYVVATVKGNKDQMFKKLLDHGAKTDHIDNSSQNLLHYSCKNSNISISATLIQQGVDVNLKNNRGETPLMIAANAGRNNVDLCALLVDAGADVNARNNKGKSVLKVADGKKLKDYLKSKGATK